MISAMQRRGDRKRRTNFINPRGHMRLLIALLTFFIINVDLNEGQHHSPTSSTENVEFRDLLKGQIMLDQRPNDDTQSKLKALRAFAQQMKISVPSSQTRNITITKERIGSAAAARWDDDGGVAIDSVIKDDGPQQLQYAMLALASVAGTIICGGAIVVACCWQHRERGHLKGSKYQKVDGDDKSPYQGQGAKWLQTPV